VRLIFFDNTFHDPWVVETPRASVIASKVMPHSQYVFSFHTLLEGACWAEMIDGSAEPMRLNADDVIVFPLDDAHAFCSTVGMRAAPDLAVYIRPVDRQLPYILNEGLGPNGCRFICGYIGCDIRPYNPFIKSLPRVLHGRSAASGWLSHLVQHAVSETENRNAVGKTVLAKLAKLMFVQVIRQYENELPPESRGWLSGLRDPQVGHALSLVHASPADDWTIEALASAVGMSRSAFAMRFAHFSGDTPMQYLGKWRIQLAARRLENPQVSIAQAGVEVGNDSEAAFNRAFKKVMGVPPGTWRRGRSGEEAIGQVRTLA
jgi:AraC-like DNA-binding protein